MYKYCVITHLKTTNKIDLFEKLLDVFKRPFCSSLLGQL